jgi:hypothetical protein
MANRPRVDSFSPQPADLGSLVNWDAPEANARALDWRERAHRFGLLPVDQDGICGSEIVEPPERFLEEEEPEAFEAQHPDRDERDAGELEE